MSSPPSLLQQATVQLSSLQQSWWAWSPLWFCCWCWPTPCTWSSTSSTLTVMKSTRPPSTSPAPPKPSSQTRTVCEERWQCCKTSKRPAWKGLLVLILDGCVVLLVFLLPGTTSSLYHCLNLLLTVTDWDYLINQVLKPRLEPNLDSSRLSRTRTGKPMKWGQKCV